MRKEYIKVSVLILIFFLFYGFFGVSNYVNYGKINNSQDFFFHFNSIKERNTGNYPFFYHFVSVPFAFNEISFYLYNLILIIIIIPILLFYLTKNFFSVCAYFALTNLPHLMIFGATYPQALIIIFFLLYLIDKNLFLPLLFFATFTHKSGLMFFLAIALIEFFVLIYKNFKLKFNSVFLSGFLIGSRITGIKEILSAILTFVPLPLIYFSKKAFSNPFYFLLILSSIFAAVYFDIRALWIMQISLILNFVPPKKNKKAFLVLVFLYVIFFLINYGFPTIKLILSG